MSRHQELYLGKFPSLWGVILLCTILVLFWPVYNLCLCSMEKRPFIFAAHHFQVEIELQLGLVLFASISLSLLLAPWLLPHNPPQLQKCVQRCVCRHWPWFGCSSRMCCRVVEKSWYELWLLQILPSNYKLLGIVSILF